VKMTDKIRRLLKQGKTAKEIAAQLKIEPNRVYTVKWLDGKKAKKPSKLMKAVIVTQQEIDALIKPLPENKPKKSKAIQEGNDLANKIFQETYDKYHPDLVNHPPHYKSGGIETIDFIEAKDLNYRLGNVVKYVSRAGRKAGSDPVLDLEKAAFYLQREINARKNA
jgi:hypothetical protein